MATVADIIDGGFAKSSAARPETMTEEAELVELVDDLLQEAFQELARVNPYVLGDIMTIEFDGTGWPKPVSCLRGIRLKASAATVATPAIAVGGAINIVPDDDPLVCEGAPSVVEFGQRYVPAGQAMDPAAGELTFYFVRMPTAPADFDATIDALFPPQGYNYLKFGVAEYLADKDKRTEDQARFEGKKTQALARLLRWAEAQTYDVVQRHAMMTAPLTNDDGGRQQPGAGGG